MFDHFEFVFELLFYFLHDLGPNGFEHDLLGIELEV